MGPLCRSFNFSFLFSFCNFAATSLACRVWDSQFLNQDNSLVSFSFIICLPLPVLFVCKVNQCVFITFLNCVEHTFTIQHTTKKLIPQYLEYSCQISHFWISPVQFAKSSLPILFPIMGKLCLTTHQIILLWEVNLWPKEKSVFKQKTKIMLQRICEEYLIPNTHWSRLAFVHTHQHGAIQGGLKPSFAFASSHLKRAKQQFCVVFCNCSCS